MATVTRTKTYAVCPHCSADAGCIDHLLGTEISTAWYCDACGGRYRLTFTRAAVQIQPMDGRKVTTIDVLVLKPQSKPLYFVVEGMRFDGEGPIESAEDAHAHKAFYYDEHSCPTNWLKPEMVYFDGDSDPHGVIEFVASRDASAFPPDEDYGPNPHDHALVAFIESTFPAPPETQP